MSHLAPWFELGVVASQRFELCSDEELLLKSADAPDAFAIFYRRHVERVLRYFATRTDSAEQAADLMAETFASAFTAARRFRPGPEPPVAWLFTIAQRRLTDARRRGRIEHSARRRLALEPLVLDDADLQRIEELSAAPEADSLLADLSPLEREAVRLRIVDERSYDEIAASLKCSPLVVRQRVSRGLRRMRQGLQGGTS